MKTDKILQLIQQKNVMRSGGALPLPKAQWGFMTPPSIKLQQVQQPVSKVASLNINKPIKQREDFKPWWNWASVQAAGGNRRQEAYGSLGDLYAYYAGQPLKHSVLEYSQYKPTNAKNPEATYISINDAKFKQEVIDNYNRVFNEKKLLPDETQVNNNTYAVSGYTRPRKEQMKRSKSGELYYEKGKDHVSNAIGRYYLSKGKDNKGEYISYYDIFDVGTGSDGGGIGETLGLTKPFEIYDRIYLDPKTGKPINENKEGGLAKAQNGLQYVPNGTYGNYYDPATQQYIPQVYLPDVDIVADRELPFQNGKFAPFLASRGMAENSVFDDPIAMGMFGAFRAGKPLVEGLKQFGKNVASEAASQGASYATYGLSDFVPNISKKLIDPSSPEFKIQQLQTEGFLPESLSEKGVQDLVRNPNLLDLAVRRNVKDRLTVARTVRPGTEAVSSQGTVTQFAPDDVRLMEELGADVSPETQALFMGTRIPFERYGQRVGADEIPSSFDVLYHYRNKPESPLFTGVDTQYGTHTVFSRYPFDFTGSADDLVRRYKQFENSKSSEFIREAPGTEYTGKLIDTPDEAFVIGKPGERVLNPIKVVSTPRLKAEYDNWYKDAQKVNMSLSSGFKNPNGLDFKGTQDMIEKYTGFRPNNIKEAWSKFNTDFIMQGQPMNRQMASPNPADISSLHYSPFKFKFRPGGLTTSKAREILHDKSVHGKPLTEKQRRFFGAIASGNKVRVRLPK